MARLARFAWWTLAYNLLVIAWGAYVRASGSGAGCGSHWPLCNGEVVPASPTASTLIEYSHRLTSGVALLAVVALLVWTWRACTSGHPARRGAVLSMVFMLTEAAVGAGLVLFELVADNATMARAMFMGVHLVNTFFLLGALSLTAWWLSGQPALRFAARRGTALWVGAGCLALALVGSSGAVAALGDTLFPAASLAEGLAADLSTSSHVLIRLRTLHPVLAVAVALGLLAGAGRLVPAGQALGLRLHRALVWLVWGQLALGVLNVVLLAPTWLQIVHLLVADAVWIAFVLLGALALGHPAAAPATVLKSVRGPVTSSP
ncbi:MAG: heme A synthase [Acidobacteria bacterium]|nr:heme A synthase [Acidobacteriota bacterium]